jgi:hypothetical protein
VGCGVAGLHRGLLRAALGFIVFDIPRDVRPDVVQLATESGLGDTA